MANCSFLVNLVYLRSFFGIFRILIDSVNIIKLTFCLRYVKLIYINFSTLEPQGFKKMIRLIFGIALLCVICTLIGAGWGIASYNTRYNYEPILKNVKVSAFAHFINKPAVGENDKIISEWSKAIPHYSGMKLDTQNPSYYYQIMLGKSRKYNMEPSLINAVIKVESNWNPNAVSRSGAKGLMQLMPITAREMNVKNPFNPEENIEGGIRYLKSLLDRFNGDLSLALAAYNAGPRRIKKYGDIPPIPETQHYVKRVLLIYNGKSPDSKKPNPHI